MNNKPLGVIIFASGGLILGLIYAAYHFLWPKNNYEKEESSCTEGDKAATTSDQLMREINGGKLIFNQNNNYISNHVSNIQNNDINLANKESQELKEKNLYQQQKIDLLSVEINLLKNEIENLKKNYNLHKDDAGQKLNTLYRYIVQTNLEQCDIISWIKSDISAEQRKELLDLLQLKVLEEAKEIAVSNSFVSTIPELDVVGNYFEIVE